MENDLTILYYTGNRLDEEIALKIRDQLKQASGNYKIISVSQKPIELGENICVGDIGYSYINIYKQMLIGAKAVKTKYLAIAEDDCLYSKEHFTAFRPKDDEVAYDMSKWSLYTWSEPPIYSIKNRRTNTTLIAPTALLIEALEERFKKYPNDADIPLKYFGEIGRYEKALGVTVRNVVEYTASVPTIVFSHEKAIGFDYLGTRKALGSIKAYDIPYWGTAKQVKERIYGTKI